MKGDIPFLLQFSKSDSEKTKGTSPRKKLAALRCQFSLFR